MNKKLLFIILVAAVSLSACNVMEPAIIEGPTVLDIGRDYAESIMQALSEGDYSQFTQSFNQDMLKAITESDFVQLSHSIFNIFGTYDSIEYIAIEESDDLILIYYDCLFEKGNLTMKLVLDPKPPYLISGFWFPDFNP